MVKRSEPLRGCINGSDIESDEGSPLAGFGRKYNRRSCIKPNHHFPPNHNSSLIPAFHHHHHHHQLLFLFHTPL
ncbi:hypothetical protein QVD17_22067 [Tagetes erecta]|uniref:Uncharacterized protein n=1 Tax=Tagetes erecta TaxID=13708 RepID=A0AAD8NTC6_TARER|nr:hypothetical protein QVD17_22067 [Tagetes erecta]